MRHKPLTFSDKELEIIDAMEEREKICKQVDEAKKLLSELKKQKQKYTLKAICARLGCEMWQIIKVWY